MHQEALIIGSGQMDVHEFVAMDTLATRQKKKGKPHPLAPSASVLRHFSLPLSFSTHKWNEFGTDRLWQCMIPSNLAPPLPCVV